MGIYYLNFGSYWRNLTAPLTYWHRGTAFQSDQMKDYLEIQLPHTELGIHMVLLTMAARTVQAIISLVKNRLHRRARYLKMISSGWMSRAVLAVLWLCWRVVDLCAAEMIRVYVDRSRSKHKLRCDALHTMSAISIKYHWGYPAEPGKEEELLSNTLTMEKHQEDTHMDVDSGCKLFSNMDNMVSREMMLSCTNPVILSMICTPLEDEESLLPSGESDIEGGDELEKDSSLKEMSVDSGVQEPWAQESKDDQDGDEESDWSEDDDSWDEDGDTEYNKEAEDLWASFCNYDDPYNPLSFAASTRSSKQQDEQFKKEVPVASLESPDCAKWSSAFRVVCGPAGEKHKCTAKRPVLSSFRSSHKCFLKDELECSQDAVEQGKEPIKRVRFSSAVTVHPIVVWDYAHRMARKGPWEEYARDRSRFQRRIADTEAAIGYCLEPGHRERIWAGLAEL